MNNAIEHFRTNIERVRALGGQYEAITRLTTAIVDSTDILRAQIVLVVSALDHYIHEITRLGMLEVLTGTRVPTNAFRRFQVTMDSAMGALSGNGRNTWFDAEIREKHGYLAFQHPDKIADAIRLFSGCELWPSVSTCLGLSVQDIKTHLRLIVERRNKIAHEADLDPSYPDTRWPISPADTEESIQFIVAICETIHSVVTQTISAEPGA